MLPQDVCLIAVTTGTSVPQSSAAEHLKDCSSFFSITSFLPPKTITLTVSEPPTTVTETTTDATRTFSEIVESTTTTTQTLTSLDVSTSTTTSTSFVGVVSFPVVVPRDGGASSSSFFSIRSPTRVPDYATAACTDAAKYSSACSRLGLAPHTVTLNGESVTITVTAQSTVVEQEEATSTVLTTSTSVTTATVDTTTTILSTTVVRSIDVEPSPVPWCTPSQGNTAEGCNGRQFANTCFQRLAADTDHPVLFSAQQLNARTCATVCDTDSLCTGAFFNFNTRICVGLGGTNPQAVATDNFVESFFFDGPGTNSDCPSYSCPDSTQNDFCCGGTGCGSQL
ncbi:hypothetical protein SBRCBS47491_002373 [Sporothrix bragantina]|uniref:Apple domain-containing protein n=1 Tax=Sporothrix bragantina TaxID=671064 RepID=A0ABP0B689_9PEZI